MVTKSEVGSDLRETMGRAVDERGLRNEEEIRRERFLAIIRAIDMYTTRDGLVAAVRLFGVSPREVQAIRARKIAVDDRIVARAVKAGVPHDYLDGAPGFDVIEVVRGMEMTQDEWGISPLGFSPRKASVLRDRLCMGIGVAMHSFAGFGEWIREIRIPRGIAARIGALPVIENGPPVVVGADESFVGKGEYKHGDLIEIWPVLADDMPEDVRARFRETMGPLRGDVIDMSAWAKDVPWVEKEGA